MLVFGALSSWVWGEGANIERKTELGYSMKVTCCICVGYTYTAAVHSSEGCGAIFGVIGIVSGQKMSVQGNFGVIFAQKHPFSPIFI